MINRNPKFCDGRDRSRGRPGEPPRLLFAGARMHAICTRGCKRGFCTRGSKWLGATHRVQCGAILHGTLLEAEPFVTVRYSTVQYGTVPLACWEILQHFITRIREISGLWGRGDILPLSACGGILGAYSYVRTYVRAHVRSYVHAGTDLSPHL